MLFSLVVLLLLVVSSSIAQESRPLAIYAATTESGAGLHAVKDTLEQTFFIHATPDLDDRDVATAEYGERGDLPAIKLTFTPTGAQKFLELTRRHLGKPLVFMAGDKVLMAPIIETAITTSYVWITTAFSESEVHGLAATMSKAVSKAGR